jgi:transcriptional regulator with XRE-family HTH domain
MGREMEDEEQDRRQTAGRWLRRERDARRLEQQEVADRLGISQQQYSKYELGLAPVRPWLAPGIAEVLGLDEAMVWRGLLLPLPVEFRTEEAVEAYYMRRHPEVFRAVEEMLAGREEGNPVPKPRHSGVNRPDITQSGDAAPVASQRRVSGV